MATKLEQAVRQALDYLENSHARFYEEREKAITALREALAEQALSKVTSDEHCKGLGEELHKLAEQAEQEPVAIDWEPLQNFWRNNSSIDWEELESAVKCAVAAPVRTKDLTDDEILDVVRKTLGVDDERFEFQGGRILTIRESELLPTSRAVIAADREKNK